MNTTNIHNLPEALVNALIYDDYDYENAGNISVTSLILPPRLRQLLKRHNKEITEDVSERIWRVIGSIGHKIVERGAPANTFSEERLSTKLHGWVITGKVDLMRLKYFTSFPSTKFPDGELEYDAYAIEDFKFRSVWAAKDLKPEDERQLNLYALLARHSGFNVTQLRIISVLRDWSKPRASREPDYPQAGVAVREVPLWSPEEQEAFLGERVRAHQRAEKLSDDELPMCSDEERWKRPDVWAVKKKGNKRALRLFNNEADAIWMREQSFLEGKGQHEVEYRPGSYPRCAMYCTVREFCSFGKTLGAPVDEEAAA